MCLELLGDKWNLSAGFCALHPLQKANKGQSRAIERLKKKMFENEFLLLLNSPTIPFRIHNRNGKVRNGGTGQSQPRSSVEGCPLSMASGRDLWKSGTQAPSSQKGCHGSSPGFLLLTGVEPVPSAGHQWHCHSCHWAFQDGGPPPAASFSKCRGAWVRRSLIGAPESRNVLGLTVVTPLNCHLSSELPVPIVLGL